MDSNASRGDLSARKLTPAPPQRVNFDEALAVPIVASGPHVTPHKQGTTSSNFRRRRDRSQSKLSEFRRALEHCQEQESLETPKKRLLFEDEMPTLPEHSGDRTGRDGGNNGDEAGVDGDNNNAVNNNKDTSNKKSIDYDCDLDDLRTLFSEKESSSQVKLQRSKRLESHDVSCPLEERCIFDSQSRSTFEQLMHLREESCQFKFNFSKRISELLSLQEAKLKESTEVYQAFEKFQDALRKEIKLFQSADSLILSLFSSSIKGAFGNAMNVKSVQNLAESVSGKSTTRKITMTSKGHSNAAVAKGKINPSAEKQSAGSRSSKSQYELRSMTGGGKKAEASSKPVVAMAKLRTSLSKPVPAKVKAPAAPKMQTETFPSTRKGKENVDEASLALKEQNPVGEVVEAEGGVEENPGIQHVSFHDLPTTPVTTRSGQRKIFSDTRTEKLFASYLESKDENCRNPLKELSPL